MKRYLTSEYLGKVYRSEEERECQINIKRTTLVKARMKLLAKASLEQQRLYFKQQRENTSNSLNSLG